ncbi:LPS export ABC transporter permease LptG [Bradyrhizobium elkanii]
MSMVTNTLGRYFAGRFVVAAVGVFAGIFVLLVLVDYIEMVRKTSGLVSASAITVAETSLFRVPQLLEKLMPFCVLIGAMTCYLALSRRLELVVARAAGVSAWQFISPALASAILLGIFATTAYNPVSANLRELSKRMEAELFGSAPGGGIQDASGFWLNQINDEGQAIINAARSEQQGVRLTGLTVFRFDTTLQFKERIEAREAALEDGRWVFKSVRRFTLDKPPVDQDTFYLTTTLTPGTGAQQFLHPGNCVLLATAELHPFVGEFRVRDGWLSLAVSQAHRTAVFAGCDGDVGGFCEPPLLSDGRRAEDGFEWRGRRLSALRAVESN